jgi:hypothetical protein
VSAGQEDMVSGTVVLVGIALSFEHWVDDDPAGLAERLGVGGQGRRSKDVSCVHSSMSRGP